MGLVTGESKEERGVMMGMHTHAPGTITIVGLDI